MTKHVEDASASFVDDSTYIHSLMGRDSLHPILARFTSTPQRIKKYNLATCSQVEKASRTRTMYGGKTGVEGG